VTEQDKCPKCGNAWVAGEQSCKTCAAPPEQAKLPKRSAAQLYAKTAHREDAKGGSFVLLVLASLCILAAVVFYLVYQRQLDQIVLLVTDLGGGARNPEDVKKAEENLASTRLMINVISAAYAILGLAYFGLWRWAKTNPFPALLTALILFFITQGVNIVLDPLSYVNPVKTGLVLIVSVVLGISIRSARKQRLKETAA